jgi:hypothetical protein
LSQEGNFGTDIKKSSAHDSLSSTFESCLIRFKIEGLVEKDFSFIEVCGWFIMLEHQSGMFNKMIQILLDTACKKPDSDTWNANDKGYLFDNSRLG